MTFIIKRVNINESLKTFSIMKKTTPRKWRLWSLVKSLIRKPAQYPPFIQVIRKYVSKEITENKLTESTIKKYEGFLKNVEDYLNDQRLTHIGAMDVRIKHMEDFKFWLHKHLDSCSLTHSARHLELCRRALKYAVQQDLIPYNTLESLKTKRDRPKEVISLEFDEFKKWIEARFVGELYRQCQHLYIFMAVTGQSHCDTENFEIVKDKSGREWVEGTRRKSKIKYSVPLHPFAKVILDHYEGKLPVIPNGTYNRIIKEIANNLGIKKYLTTHTARKTFATQMFDNGWSIDGLKLMLGHRSSKTTENNYVKRSRNRLEKEMKELHFA